MKITTIDSMYVFPEHLKILESFGTCTIYDTRPNDAGEALARVKEANVIIDFWYPMPAELMNQLLNTKLIVAASSGYDWIDISAAKEKNITVVNCPGNNAEAVAEHTVGLLLAALRKTIEGNQSIREGKWDSFILKGFEIQGKTVGIIGHGRIGKRVGEILEKGFGAKIIAVNSTSSRGDLENLLKQSDIISVNAPLNDNTRDMIGEKEFGLMKQNVVIVNTGRGGIINQNALISALNSGKVFAAGLDTYEKEPTEKGNSLFVLPNVVLTPHIAWNTEESKYRISQMVMENVKAFIQEKPQFVVNP